MKKNRKKKINLIAIGNMVGLIGGALYILETMYQVIFKIQTLTYFGLGLTIVAFIVCGSNFNYFEERWER